VLELDIEGSRSHINGMFGKWCWRRLEVISWTGHARNAEVLHGVEGALILYKK
jgi:hypothetical protein